MKISTRLCGVAAATLLLPACATITRGTEQKYAIQSTPSEAQVELSTGQTCTTPCKLKLKRKHGFTATFTKPGYQTATAQVKSKLSGGGAAAGAGNVLVGGIIGGLVDGSSGALNNLTPNPLNVQLVAIASEAPAAVEAPAADAATAEAPAAEAPAAPAPTAAAAEAAAPAPGGEG